MPTNHDSATADVKAESDAAMRHVFEVMRTFAVAAKNAAEAAKNATDAARNTADALKQAEAASVDKTIPLHTEDISAGSDHLVVALKASYAAEIAFTNADDKLDEAMKKLAEKPKKSTSTSPQPLRMRLNVRRAQENKPKRRRKSRSEKK
jgi:hypothetical protein